MDCDPNSASYSPEKMFAALEKAATIYARAEYNYTTLNKAGEILIAKLILAAKEAGTPITLCKETARATDEWAQHIAGEIAALEMYRRARLRYHNLEALADHRRTQEVTTRAITT